MIPDIHGCAKTLEALFSELIRPEGTDSFYFLGDYIDRGPYSRETIDFIMNLERSGFKVRALIGNHEDFMLRTFDEESQRKSFLGFRSPLRVRKEWLSLGGRKTLESFKVKNLLDIPRDYIDWMRRLEYFIELDHFFLVHAGFNFKKDDPFEDKSSMLWVRDYDIRPEKVRNKKIIHGHMPVSLEFIDMSIRTKSYWFIDLDNGCYMNNRDGFGNLVALELNSMEYVVQYNRDY